MASFFKKVNTSVPLDKQDQIINPVLAGDPNNADVYLLVPEVNRGYLKYITKVVEKYFLPERICILFVYKFVPTEKDEKNLGAFVRKYTIPLEQYIKPWSKIICFGRAIYSITQETELTSEAFYAYDYVDTKFFCPLVSSWVFPVDDPFHFVSLASKKFLDTFSFHFFQKQVTLCSQLRVTPLRRPELKVEIVENPNEFLKQYIGKEMKVAWDLETDGLLWYKGDVICLTLSFDGRTGYYLPWEKIDPAVLSDFFEGKYQIGANLKFDIKFLMLKGVENLTVDFDTLQAGHVLNEMRSNSLGSHGWIYTLYGGHEVPLLKYKENHKGIQNYGQIPRSILSDYAAKDAIITYQVYEAQLKELEKDKANRPGLPNLYDYFFNEMMPNVRLYYRIEFRGIYVDWERMNNLGSIYQSRKEELEKKIFAEVGHTFNLASVRELAQVLEHELHWPDLGSRSKAGDYLTGEDSLDAWEKMGYSLATLLKQYKEITTFIKTFIGGKNTPLNGWQRFSDFEGYIHPTYQVMMADSGRQKSNSPNWQQVPKQGDGCKEYRLVFQPPKDSRNFIYSTRSISLTLEDGSTLEFSRYENLKVNRNGEEIVIQARYLQEGDDFIKVV